MYSTNTDYRHRPCASTRTSWAGYKILVSGNHLQSLPPDLQNPRPLKPPLPTPGPKAPYDISSLHPRTFAASLTSIVNEPHLHLHLQGLQTYADESPPANSCSSVALTPARAAENPSTPPPGAYSLRKLFAEMASFFNRMRSSAVSLLPSSSKVQMHDEAFAILGVNLYARLLDDLT